MKWIQILYLLVSCFSSLYNLAYQRGEGILGEGATHPLFGSTL